MVACEQAFFPLLAIFSPFPRTENLFTGYQMEGFEAYFSPSSKTQGLLIGARKLVFFWHQSEARTAATVWNWSGKTLSPGALLAVLSFSSFHIYFSPRLDFPSPPLSAPGSPRMISHTCYYERMPSPLTHSLIKQETKYSLKNQLCFTDMPTPKTEIVKK